MSETTAQGVPHGTVQAAETSSACHLSAAQRWGLRGRVEAVCLVHQLVDDSAGTVGVTAIDKRPVDGPVKVRRLGLHGDIQADREHHGGEDKAVYVYAEEDAQWWSEQLSTPIPAGRFGENLRLTGVNVSGAVPGERWRIGDRLLLEVTRPRIPCATFGRWMNQDRWVRRFLEAGRPGAYLRVITPGPVAPANEVEIVSVAEVAGPSVGEIAASTLR